MASMLILKLIKLIRKKHEQIWGKFKGKTEKCLTVQNTDLLMRELDKLWCKTCFFA